MTFSFQIKVINMHRLTKRLRRVPDDYFWALFQVQVCINTILEPSFESGHDPGLPLVCGLHTDWLFLIFDRHEGLLYHVPLVMVGIVLISCTIWDDALVRHENMQHTISFSINASVAVLNTDIVCIHIRRG